MLSDAFFYKIIENMVYAHLLERLTKEVCEKYNKVIEKLMKYCYIYIVKQITNIN